MYCEVDYPQDLTFSDRLSANLTVLDLQRVLSSSQCWSFLTWIMQWLRRSRIEPSWMGVTKFFFFDKTHLIFFLRRRTLPQRYLYNLSSIEAGHRQSGLRVCSLLQKLIQTQFRVPQTVAQSDSEVSPILFLRPCCVSVFYSINVVLFSFNFLEHVKLGKKTSVCISTPYNTARIFADAALLFVLLSDDILLLLLS